MYNKNVRGVLIQGNKTYGQITNEILAPQEKKAPAWWFVAMFVSTLAMAFGLWAIYTTISQGIGTWGVNNSIAWGWGIINFVWWIGIGHAGTAFSIFLLILRQKWRTSINRAAEAMTVVAVICAGMFPLLHMGRLWMAFFIFPYPNSRGPVWVNFNSPLFWDVVAISTYFMASATFWYLGMIPDLATIRDRAKSKLKKAIYGLMSFGWVGTAKSWLRFETTAMIVGGLAAPLVIAVHSIVSMDFATSVMAGWHTTVFPPYFVIGAIFSGFAMVLTLMIIIRKVFKFEDFVTDGHLDAIGRILTFISLIMGTAYSTEIFIAWYSGMEGEIYTFFHNRISGDHMKAFWTMVTCNAIIPQLFWFKKVRKNLWLVFIISIIINIGMWFERYVIVVTSLSKDYLPANWAEYSPTIVEIGTYIGTLGIFGIGVLLFIRYIPMMAMSELKMILKGTSIVTNQKTEDHE
ncbi:MAG TPA: polysulfide reductase NrfD [Bacteroidales bacterium]|nr:polysulfide reductase NrfD [Bacteroidales bacterium]HPE57318.1 polysulfide reductase NrfD [Bacteroidales bacterium]HRX95836.1 polysulfide reductase NrfD [Bacteroidales bacterium]